MLGLNMKARVWRMVNDPTADDDVGGAMITGTLVYGCINMRFTPRPTNFMLLEQGLETRKLEKVMMQPQSLVLYERDELEITGPTNHSDYGHRFRIIELNRQGMHPSDPRMFIHATVERIDRTRQQQ
jgi:hypothetical protein